MSVYVSINVILDRIERLKDLVSTRHRQDERRLQLLLAVSVSCMIRFLLAPHQPQSKIFGEKVKNKNNYPRGLSI